MAENQRNQMNVSGQGQTQGQNAGGTQAQGGQTMSQQDLQNESAAVNEQQSARTNGPRIQGNQTDQSAVNTNTNTDVNNNANIQQQGQAQGQSVNPHQQQEEIQTTQGQSVQQQQAEQQMVSDSQTNQQQTQSPIQGTDQTAGYQQQAQQQGGVNANADINMNTNNDINNDVNNNVNTNTNAGTNSNTNAEQGQMKYLGGGWYQLWDGTKIQGEDEAKKALEELNHESQKQQQAEGQMSDGKRQQVQTQVQPGAQIQEVIISEGDTIQALGPKAENSGAEVLRYRRKDGRQGSLDIRAGAILYVGQDLTEEEAQELMNSQIWNFERVTI